MKKTFIGILMLALIFTAAMGLLIADGLEVGDRDGGGDEPVQSHRPDIATPPDTAGTLPELDTQSWELRLVSAEAPLPAGFEIETGLTSEGYMFDARAVQALEDMLAAGRNAGLPLALNSAYRTYEYQESLFENKVNRVMAQQGLGREEAEEAAALEVARPGTSEHQLGLAADIVSENYGAMDAGYADTPEAKWLLDNCDEYGFILRYPQDKAEITKTVYEPWHFRYVGTEAAKYITENGLCLEEFLELYK